MFFKKVACFTDIHFGMKGNSRVHNDDCEAFIYWFIDQAKASPQSIDKRFNNELHSIKHGTSGQGI